MSLPSVQEILTLPKGVLVAAGVVIVFGLLWLGARLNRWRHVVIAQTEAVRTTLIQLGRIADSLERVSFSMQAKAAQAPAHEVEDKDGGRMGLSMLGR